MARRRGRSFERVLERTEFSDMRSDSWEVNQNSEFESVDSDFDYDFEKDGIREGDNIRDPEGNLVLDLDPNEVSGVDFSQDDEAQFSNSDTFLDDVLDIDEEYKIDSRSIPDSAFMESDMPLDDKKLSPPKVKTRADSRNNGIKISKQLEEKLGKSNTAGINILVNLDRMLNTELSLSSCTDEMRLAISEKMVGLTDLLAKIYKITKSHVSNDKKKEQLEALVDKMDIIGFTANLYAEINATREILIKKAKQAAKNINESLVKEAEIETGNNEVTTIEEVVKNEEQEIHEEVEETKEAAEEKSFNPATDTPNFSIRGTSLTPEDEKMVDEILGKNMENEEETYDSDKLFEVEDDLYDPDKLFEVEGDKEEKGLITQEKVGFFGKIKRFFSNIKEAYKRATENSKVVKLAEETIKRIDERSEHEDNGKYTKAGFSVMGKIKDVLNAAIEAQSGREVTPNIIENIANRIVTFSGDKKIGAMCKGIVKDVWEFSNVVAYNIGDYVVTEGKKGVKTIRNARNQGMDR